MTNEKIVPIEHTACPMCDHNKRMTALADARSAHSFELYVTYYKQTRALEKGIKRLHRKIARLEKKRVATPTPERRERQRRIRADNYSGWHRRIGLPDRRAAEPNAAGQGVTASNDLRVSDRGEPVGDEARFVPTRGGSDAKQVPVPAAPLNEATITARERAIENTFAAPDSQSIPSSGKEWAGPYVQPTIFGSIPADAGTVFCGAVTSGLVKIRTADLPHKMPDAIIGGHDAPEPAPSKKSTLPLSAEQVGHDYFLVMNVTGGRFREGDDMVRAGLAAGRLMNQALAAIELERKLSGAKQHAEACFAVARKYGLFKFSSEPPAVYLDRHITELRAAITARNQRELDLIRENAELKVRMK